MEPKKFGYGRVSSKGQNLDRQLVDLIMREGDILIVTELERFGRNYTEIHNDPFRAV